MSKYLEEDVYYKIVIYYRRSVDVDEVHIVEEYQLHPGFLELEGEIDSADNYDTIYISSALIDHFTVEEVVLS